MRIKNKSLFFISISIVIAIAIVVLNDWQRSFFPGNNNVVEALLILLCVPSILAYFSLENSKGKQLEGSIGIAIPILLGVFFFIIIKWNSSRILENNHSIVKGIVTHHYIKPSKGPVRMIEFQFEANGQTFYCKAKNGKIDERVSAGDSIFVKYAVLDPLINTYWPVNKKPFLDTPINP